MDSKLLDRGEGKAEVALDYPKSQRITRNVSLAAGTPKESNPDRYVVRIISVRIRLLDEDNLCPKYAVDFLRYCGAIPSDAPGKCKVETTQRKVEKGEEEHTEVRVWGLFD